MVFVIGGAYQGKLSYVMNKYNVNSSEVLDGKTCTLEENIENIKVVNGLNKLIKRLLTKDLDVNKVEIQAKDVLYMLSVLFAKNEDIIIISDEIGYGIVPMDKIEREYRELTGRVCCELASESIEVYRVALGIATKIKG